MVHSISKNMCSKLRKNIIPVWKKETFFDIFFDISILFSFTNWLHVNHKRLNYILKFVFCSKYEIWKLALLENVFKVVTILCLIYFIICCYFFSFNNFCLVKEYYALLLPQSSGGKDLFGEQCHFAINRVSHETWQLVNSFKCLLP